jgi:hypothetical protein
MLFNNSSAMKKYFIKIIQQLPVSYLNILVFVGYFMALAEAILL